MDKIDSYMGKINILGTLQAQKYTGFGREYIEITGINTSEEVTIPAYVSSINIESGMGADGGIKLKMNGNNINRYLRFENQNGISIDMENVNIENMHEVITFNGSRVVHADLGDTRLKDVSYMFYKACIDEQSISMNTSLIEKADSMFNEASADRLIIDGARLNSLRDAQEIFAGSRIEELIIRNIKLKDIILDMALMDARIHSFTLENVVIENASMHSLFYGLECDRLTCRNVKLVGKITNSMRESKQFGSAGIVDMGGLDMSEADIKHKGSVYLFSLGSANKIILPVEERARNFVLRTGTARNFVLGTGTAASCGVIDGHT